MLYRNMKKRNRVFPDVVERVAKEVKRIVGWFDHVEGSELARDITEGVGGDTTKQELHGFWQRIAPEGPRGLGRRKQYLAVRR